MDEGRWLLKGLLHVTIATHVKNPLVREEAMPALE